MKKILAIGGSNSRKSINLVLAAYAASQLKNVEVETIGVNDFELPLYGPDLESESGIPENAHSFHQKIEAADGVVLSMAEYNGLHSTAFKNLWDWASRIDQKIWKNKPMLLMASSPGGRGGANVLRITKELIPHFGGNVVAEFSLPSFFENFQDGELVNTELKDSLSQQIAILQKAI